MLAHMTAVRSRCTACKRGQVESGLCAFFQQAALAIWQKTGFAREHNLKYSEETITETTFMDLHRAKLPGVRVHLYSRSEESRVGADWEWYFGTPGSWMAARVQAKRIDNRLDFYKKLNYTVPRTGRRQLDLLISQARNTHLPLVAFYNHWDWSPLYERLCRIDGDSRMKEQWGCSIGCAKRIRGYIEQRGPTHVSQVMPSCLPWQCLVCCADVDTGLASVATTVRTAFSQLVRQDELPPMLREIPPYVPNLPLLGPSPQLTTDLTTREARMVYFDDEPPPPEFNLAGAVVVEVPSG